MCVHVLRANPDTEKFGNYEIVAGFMKNRKKKQRGEKETLRKGQLWSVTGSYHPRRMDDPHDGTKAIGSGGGVAAGREDLTDEVI